LSWSSFFGGFPYSSVPQLDGGGTVATEYLADARIDEIIRANLREIAQEMGEWHEIHEVNGATDADGNARPIVLHSAALFSTSSRRGGAEGFMNTPPL
jgi:hypothetical protein